MNIRALLRVAHLIVDDMRWSGPDFVNRKIRSMENYHGFGKFTWSSGYLRFWCEHDRYFAPRNINPTTIQAELVMVERDLSHEIHYHEKSLAYVVCLGHLEHLPNPVGARTYRNGAWRVIVAGERIIIPPSMPHGFTVEPGGILFFLSVQTPPIIGEGTDDYHRSPA